MLETGLRDRSLRALLRESSRRRDAARAELRERIAGALAIALVTAVPLYGLVSDSGIALVEESVAAEPKLRESVPGRLQTSALSSTDVRMVQIRLKENGFDPGPIDGIAGKRTLAALNAYRQSILLSPVAVVSRETIGALR